MSRPRSLLSGLSTSVPASLFVITMIALLGLSGCGSGGSTPQQSPIGVSVAASSTSVNGNGKVTLTATVSNDSSNAGVAWTTPAIGSLSSLTAASTAYTAPASTSSSQSVTLTATSVADKTKSGSVTLTIDPSIGVSVTALLTTIDGTDSTTLTAAVTDDASNAGVTWSAPSAGSLSSSTAASPTYTAPAATGSQQTVTLTATSVADTTKSGSVTVTIPAEPENPHRLAAFVHPRSSCLGDVGRIGWHFTLHMEAHQRHAANRRDLPNKRSTFCGQFGHGCATHLSHVPDD